MTTRSQTSSHFRKMSGIYSCPFIYLSSYLAINSLCPHSFYLPTVPLYPIYVSYIYLPTYLSVYLLPTILLTCPFPFLSLLTFQSDCLLNTLFTYFSYIHLPIYTCVYLSTYLPTISICSVQVSTCISKHLWMCFNRPTTIRQINELL